MGPRLQHARPRSPGLPAHRRHRPPFAPDEARAIADAARDTEPIKHGLPGHGWTLKKLRRWAFETFRRLASRGTIRRILRAAGLSWREVKKLLGKAKPEKRAEHVKALLGLFEAVRRGEVTLVYVDESHFHRDMDSGYTWGPRGERSWRVSSCPKLSERLNWYGAYDFTSGESLIWEDGNCDGAKTCEFLRRVKEWRAGKAGRLVVIWDNAPWHIARAVRGAACVLGIELVYLPGYSPDLNPIERMWGWMRDEVTRGHCHGSLAELREACHAFIDRINRDPDGVVTRLWPKFDLDPEYEEKLRVSA